MTTQHDSNVMTIGGDEEDVIRPAFHHAFLKTTRLEDMKAWYRLVLGLLPNFEWEAGAFMTNDNANHRLVLFSVPSITEDPDKVNHAGLHHLAYEYSSYDQLLSTYERLKKVGIEPHASLNHGLTTSFYYLDPDGNSLELQYDNFGDWAKSTQFMRESREFRDEPIGQPIDPQKLVDAWHEGLSRDEIHRRSYAGEMAPASPGDIRIPGP
jgi:catechol 2,3-dioxygenase-like lactoylglutathione lyase family enzyme